MSHTPRTRLVDISQSFFESSYVDVGTIEISPRNPEDELDLTGTQARIRVSLGEDVILDENEPENVLTYDKEAKTLRVQITPELNALLFVGRNDVTIWIVFDEGPEELARGEWTKQAL